MRVSLESLGVFVGTDKSEIQIVSAVLVRRAGLDDCQVLPAGKTWDVSALWPSVGSRIASVAWGRDLVFTTDGGIEIVVPPSSSGYRGTILSTDGKNMTVEEF